VPSPTTTVAFLLPRRARFSRAVSARSGQRSTVPDLACEPGEQCRLPAVSGPDLEDAFVAGQRERFDHPRDERRLGRHLLVRDRKRRIEIGAFNEAVRNELASWNRPNRLEHSRLPDALEAKSSEQIGLARAMNHGTILPS